MNAGTVDVGVEVRLRLGGEVSDEFIDGTLVIPVELTVEPNPENIISTATLSIEDDVVTRELARWFADASNLLRSELGE